MEENMIIRNSTEKDVDAVCAIAAEQWAVIYDGYKSRMGDELYDIFYGDDPLAKKKEAVRANANDFEHCIVTEIDGAVAGFAYFRTEEVGGRLVGVLSHNAVKSDYKGRGIAGRQYDVIFEKMKALGCVAVKVHTGLDDAHAPARRAYEKAGFEKNLPSVIYYKKL